MVLVNLELIGGVAQFVAASSLMLKGIDVRSWVG